MSTFELLEKIKEELAGQALEALKESIKDNYYLGRYIGLSDTIDIINQFYEEAENGSREIHDNN